MNQITDAVLLTSSMKILNRKVRYIQEKLNLTEINIDWKVLEEKIYFSKNLINPQLYWEKMKWVM